MIVTPSSIYCSVSCIEDTTSAFKDFDYLNIAQESFTFVPVMIKGIHREKYEAE